MWLLIIMRCSIKGKLKGFSGWIKGIVIFNKRFCLSWRIIIIKMIGRSRNGFWLREIAVRLRKRGKLWGRVNRCSLSQDIWLKRRKSLIQNSQNMSNWSMISSKKPRRIIFYRKWKANRNLSSRPVRRLGENFLKDLTFWKMIL